jgi:3-phenylpropionate/trans-cinnamate dioxygenase ferredoxin reductase subunit
VVIVGASLAGAKAAEALRDLGFDGRITLVGEEAVRPYERPPLSKGYLRGESDFDAAAVHEADYYDTHEIDLRTSTTVAAVETDAHEVVLGSGDRLSYDRLLLATGAAPRPLSVAGAELPGVRTLRTVDDADALHRAIETSVPVVVIGAGWIGSEVTASARQLGAEVTVVERSSVPLERVLGPTVGAVFGDLHAAHGVRMVHDVGIESITGTDAVEAVRLTDGTVVPAGLVVVGVGVSPRAELAEAAGIDVDNGVVTDEYLASSAPDVFAAGDVANAFHPRYQSHLRLEHWSSALNQGPVAAANLLGVKTAYDKTPYFFSDQYDFGMEYRGWARADDDVVFRRGEAEFEFIAFWLRAERVTAAMNANVWDQGDSIEALVASDARVDPALLADPDVDLATLVPPS